MAQYRSKTHFWQTSVNDDIKPMCTAITFKNTGDQPLRINNVWRLEPGEETPSISTGDPEVVDETTYSVAFDASGGGTAPQCTALYITTNYKTTKGNGSDACDQF